MGMCTLYTCNVTIFNKNLIFNKHQKIETQKKPLNLDHFVKSLRNNLQLIEYYIILSTEKALKCLNKKMVISYASFNNKDYTVRKLFPKRD